MIELKHLLFFAEEEVDAAVLERAVRVARTHGAKLTVAAVVEPAGSWTQLARRCFEPDKVQRLLVEDRQRRLDESINRIGDADISISSHVLVGDPVVSILQAVMAEQIDFLFKSPAPSHGLRQHLFGGTDTCLMRACSCPVAIGRPRTSEGAGRAVAAIDYDKGDETKARVNHAILDASLLALRGDHPELHIVHAWSLYGESLLRGTRTGLPPERFAEVSEEERDYRQQWLDELVQRYRDTLDESHAVRFNPKIELLHGDPTIVIPQRVKQLDADVLGIGTVSRKGLSGILIGNTSEAIINRVNCTVVTIKPDDFVCPVAKFNLDDAMKTLTESSRNN